MAHDGSRAGGTADYLETVGSPPFSSDESGLRAGEAATARVAEVLSPSVEDGLPGLTLPLRRSAVADDRVFAPPIDGDTKGWTRPQQPSPAKSTSPEGPAAETQARGFSDEQVGRRLGVASPSALRALPPLPSEESPTNLFNMIWFVAAFVTPVVLGIVYYGLIAANQYVCEFRFTVRDPATSSATANATAALSGLFGPGGGASTSDQLSAFIAADYAHSPQAAADLDKRLNLRKMFAGRNGDFLARLGPHASDEKLAQYWNKMSYALTDPATGLTLVRLRAFTPKDAYAIAETLFNLTNQVVNSSGQLSRADSVRYAQLEVDRARKEATDLDARMTALRNQHGVVDPNTGEVAGNITLVNTLLGTVAQLQSQIGALTQQLHNPNAPQILPLKAQLSAARAQLASVQAQVSRQHDASYTNVVGQFESLTVQRTAAQTNLSAAIANLQQALASKDSERVYLAPYVMPHMPTMSTYPQRLRGMIIILVASLLVWVAGLLAVNAVVEHS